MRGALGDDRATPASSPNRAGGLATLGRHQECAEQAIALGGKAADKAVYYAFYQH